MITHDVIVSDLVCREGVFDAECANFDSCKDCCDHAVTEYEDFIRKEAVRKFVEWLVEKGGFQTAKIETIDGRKFDNYGQFWLAEYEKEQTK